MEQRQNRVSSARSDGLDDPGRTDGGSTLTSLRLLGLRWMDSAKSAARREDAYLHAHPWRIAGAVAAASAVAGFAYSRFNAKRKS